MGFDQLGLSKKVLEAVSAAGYTDPTEIQAAAIPHVLQRRDVLGIAQTGTGKTASFTLPMISLLEKGRARARMPRTLILEPTRELAAQVAENFEKYGVNQKLTMALLIGGVSFEEQDRKLSRGVDVLIATPGRLLDHFERGKLLMNGVDIFVIDEADRMLDMGFIPDIERISKLIPFTRQTLFFSATMPSEIGTLADKFLQNPQKVEVSKAASTASTITQRIVASGSKDWDKRATLRKLVDDAQELKNGIVFCNRKRDVGTVHRSLQSHDYSAGSLHGDMDQRSRMETLDKFKNNEITLLVASDVAARGLDIPDVSHVFNYDLPSRADDYVHRIGRTGRAGRSGTAYSIVSKADSKYLDSVEKLIGQKLEWLDGDLSSVVSSEQEEKPKRGRKPSNSRKPDQEDQAQSSSPAVEESQEGTKQDATKQDGQPAEKAPQKRQQKSDDEGTNQRNRNSNRGRNSGRNRDRDDNGPRVIGFGDHMPAFVSINFESSVTQNEEANDGADEDSDTASKAPDEETSKAS